MIPFTEFKSITDESTAIEQRTDLIKFDRETALEKFFSVVEIIFAGATAVVFWIAITEILQSLAQYWILLYVPLPVAGTLVFFLFAGYTDNYYLIDPRRHLVYYHFKFFGFQSIKLLL